MSGDSQRTSWGVRHATRSAQLAIVAYSADKKYRRQKLWGNTYGKFGKNQRWQGKHYGKIGFAAEKLSKIRVLPKGKVQKKNNNITI